MKRGTITLALLFTWLGSASAQYNCYGKFMREGDSILTSNNPKKHQLALNKFNSARRCDPSKGDSVDIAINRVFERILDLQKEAKTNALNAINALEKSRKDQINKLISEADVFRKDKRFPDAFRSYDNALKLAKPAEKATINKERSATLSAQTQFDFERNRDIGLALMEAGDGRAAMSYLLKAQEAKPSDTIVQTAIAQCDTTAHSFTAHCGTNETCLCDSFYYSGQALREKEHFNEAVKRFEVVAQLCPKRNARAVIDSIYREHRIWVYQDGKFAVATPLGQPLSAYEFYNPQPFRRGIAVCENKNGKYFFVDVNGKRLNDLPGYDGVIPVDNSSFVVKKSQIEYITVTDRNINPIFRDSFFPNKISQLYGYINLYISEISTSAFMDKPPPIDEAYFLHDGLALMREGGKWGYRDKTRKVRIPPQFDVAYIFYDKVALVKKDKNWNFIDSLGQVCVLILPQFNNADSFSDDLACVRKDGKWGYIDKSGSIRIDPQFDNAYPFSDDLACVRKDGKWGYIDKSGSILIDPPFDYAFSFSNDVACVKKDGKWGYIDKSGSILIDLQFDEADSFSDGMAPVKKDDKWGYIDKSGSILIDPEFDDAFSFSDGVAPVKKDGKWGYIDKSGSILIDLQFDNAFSFSDGVARIKKDGKWGYIDKSGSILIDPEFDDAFSFSDGVAPVKKDGKWGYIDKSGSILIDLQFDNAYSFSKGVAIVKQNSKMGLVDKAGVLVPPVIDKFHWSAEGKLSLYANERRGLLFVEERTYIPCEYEEIGQINDEWVMVMKNGKWGWVDHSGRIMIPCRYDAAAPFDAEGRAWVYQFGERFRINKKGLMVWER